MLARRFLDSEESLDRIIKSFSALAEHTQLYPIFISSGAIETLISLMKHKNSDIAHITLRVITELLDEDIQVEDENRDLLIKALDKNDFINVLILHLTRLNEEKTKFDTKSEEFELILTTCELLATIDIMSSKLILNPVFTNFLLLNIQEFYSLEDISQLTHLMTFCAELLFVILQENTDSLNIIVTKTNAIDIILGIIARYRECEPSSKRNDKDFVENCIDSLCVLLGCDEGKVQIVKNEGIELLSILLHTGTHWGKKQAIKILYHTLSGVHPTLVKISESFVEFGGLKPFFSLLSKEFKKYDSSTDHALLVEQMVSIMFNFLRVLPLESENRIRILGKFLEKKNDKAMILVKLQQKISSKISKVEEGIAKKKNDLEVSDEVVDIPEFEMEWFIELVEAGLSTLQQLDVILCWLGIEERQLHQLIFKDETSKQSITKVLVQYKDSLKSRLDTEDDDDAVEEAYELIDMIETLLENI